MRIIAKSMHGLHDCRPHVTDLDPEDQIRLDPKICKGLPADTHDSQESRKGMSPVPVERTVTNRKVFSISYSKITHHSVDV